MRFSSNMGVLALAGAAAAAISIEDQCTVDYVAAALPANNTINGIFLLPDTVTAAIVDTDTTTSSYRRRDNSTTTTYGYPYCNVTVSYARPGLTNVVLTLALPNADDFENRWYVAGGEAYSLATTATDGVEYGAAGGITSAGYDNADYGIEDVVLYANGSIDWDPANMFGYQALGEMTLIGLPFTRSYYDMGENTTLYSYYEGCSDGGRQGMSQIQRYGELYDGAVIGAPAFRYAQQQTNHIFSSVVESIQDYFPPPCELAKIVNATIAACDPLDGRIDGVVSRSDLCQLNFNISSTIGESYYCEAGDTTSLGLGYSRRLRKRQDDGSTTTDEPAQNGTVSAQGVAVAQAILDGLHNSLGERAYLSWQIGASFDDAETQYDNTTDQWVLDIAGIGGEWVGIFIELLEIDNLATLDGVTYDTVVGWMEIAYDRWLATLQTTIPDLTPFESHGGKLLHYHGEQDPSVPTASSIHYWQSVGKVMYGFDPNNGTQYADMADWYSFFLIPGAAHCASNDLQPDGPYPEDNMATMIDWVENGIAPKRLNATVQAGPDEGQIEYLCLWPERPLWYGNGTNEFDCAYDAASYATWTYDFPAFKVEIY